MAPDPSGFCYVIQAQSGPLKIGYAEADVAKRVRDVQGGCPYLLVVRAILGGGRATEKEGHRKFRAWRLRGEWFDEAAGAVIREWVEGHPARIVAHDDWSTMGPPARLLPSRLPSPVLDALPLALSPEEMRDAFRRLTLTAMPALGSVIADPKHPHFREAAMLVCTAANAVLDTDGPA